ncbi:MAG: ATP-binding protein [Alphaproteobacteria bacterium]|nr:ATP-binding protein [Alphaproteobacteria bacterium]
MDKLPTLLRAVLLAAILALPGWAALAALWLAGALAPVAALSGALLSAAAGAVLGALATAETVRFLRALRASNEGEPSEAPRHGALARLLGAAGAIDRAAQSLRVGDSGRRVAQSILDGLPVPLLLLDAERRVVRVNRAAAQIVGKAGVGRDLTASIRHPLLLQAVDAVLGGETAREVEFSLAVPVERHFTAHVGQVALDLPDVAAVVTLNDMTVIRRGEQMRADFVANASHELRTPLATLLGFVETLRGPAKDDESARERFLAIMHDQAQRMTRLVNDLLSLSRIELFEHTPPTATADVGETLRGVLDALRPQAAERKMTLELEIAPGLPPATGDEDQLAQVFQNLVVNAIKYARAGTAVTVRGWHATAAPGLVGGSLGAVAVAVIDRGDGIERRHLPRLTERFYRVDAARSRQLGGTGLGLAIVKHIVSRHRGALTIESEVGEGSTFTVYVPAARPTPRPAEAERSRTAALPEP